MEHWDAYDRFRRPLGYMIPRGAPMKKNERHLVVFMVYYNGRGEILVQRRADGKAFAPGVWALTGGSARAGEAAAQACARELEEELGFAPDMDGAVLLISFMPPDAFVDVCAVRADVEIADLRLQKSEVAEAAWLNRDEFISLARDERRFFQYAYMNLLLWILDGTEGIWREDQGAIAGG